MSESRICGLSEPQWLDLCKRVANGTGDVKDAAKVDRLGLTTHGRRIRLGYATYSDAILINFEVQIRLHGLSGQEQQQTRGAHEAA